MQFSCVGTGDRVYGNALCVPQFPEHLDILLRILVHERRRISERDVSLVQLGNFSGQTWVLHKVLRRLGDGGHGCDDHVFEEFLAGGDIRLWEEKKKKGQRTKKKNIFQGYKALTNNRRSKSVDSNLFLF